MRVLLTMGCCRAAVLTMGCCRAQAGVLLTMGCCRAAVHRLEVLLTMGCCRAAVHRLEAHLGGKVTVGSWPKKTQVARPPANNSAAMARWLVHNTVWGTIGSVSNGHDSGTLGNAFANPQSFSDGIANATDPKQKSTGTPYVPPRPAPCARPSTRGWCGGWHCTMLHCIAPLLRRRL